MSCKCELSGVGVMSGNKVSHSVRRTKRKFKPNLQSMSFYSTLINQKYNFRATPNCLSTIEKIGGFDEYMIKVDKGLLSIKARRVKALIVQKLSQQGV